LRPLPGDAKQLAEALHAAHPELDAVRVITTEPVYLVGGAVRDLLLGRGRADADLVIVGDPLALAERLGSPLVAEEARFGTAKVELYGHVVDIATARTETYPHPGALPVVEPAPDIEADLARRDFTINAIAIPLADEAGTFDPHGGWADLDAGLLRVLHPDSFVDDPTRAIRAARYASRLGFGLESETEALLRATDLGTVSEDRRDAELNRLAIEANGLRGLELLVSWGLIEPRKGGIELARRVEGLLATGPWQGQADRAEAILAAVLGPVGDEQALAREQPERPSQAVELVGGRKTGELLLARALGAEWLDAYMTEWRAVALEIDGSDLLAAGIPEGPALGRGLQAALRRKLDGEISGRDEELATALDAARAR
jgi:tRNA nucleotidyltransferase (CCA-adding enzyme)